MLTNKLILVSCYKVYVLFSNALMQKFKFFLKKKNQLTAQPQFVIQDIDY